MNVARKLRLIVIISVLIIALPISSAIYFFTQDNIIANEKRTLIAETQAFIANYQTDLTVDSERQYKINRFKQLIQYSRYTGEQHILIDNQQQFAVTDSWQTQLTTNPNTFTIDNPSISKLLQVKLSSQARVFPQTISLNQRDYIAVMVTVQAIDWRYFRLVPIDEIIAPLQKLFFALLSAILLTALLIGVLIEVNVNRNIIKRLSILADAIRHYSLVGELNIQAITGDDEIATTAHDFNFMVDKIERQRQLEINLLARDRLAVQYARDGIYVIDNKGVLVEANPAFYAMLGYQPDELLGHSVSTWNKQWKSDEVTSKINELTLQQNALFEIIHQRKDGSEINVEISTVSMELDGQHYLWCSSRNITERKQTEQYIQQLAHFDTLTQLPNRCLLYQRVNYAIASAQRANNQFAVMFLDLDHFKKINDTLGHTIGDTLLVQVSERMLDSVRKEDTVSRPGGDEFIFVLPHTNANGAANVAEKIRYAIEQPYHIEQHELNVTASIGIAIYPDDGKNFTVLSQCADIAMYSAKQEGRNTYRFFTNSM